jgi:ABC-type branched-subunit amino acid transport system substrate-binding protein
MDESYHVVQYRLVMRRRLVAWIVAAAAGLGACHHAPTRTLLTPTPDAPNNGNQQAKARYEEARQKFLNDGSSAGEFGAIVRDFPNDPIVPWAELYDGIAAIKARDFARARDVLTKVVATPSRLTQRAQAFLAIADNYAGDTAATRALVEQLKNVPDLFENEDERTEYFAAEAYALAAGDHPVEALPAFDELWPRVSATEQAVIAERVEAIVATAGRDALQHVHDVASHRDRIVIAVVASRLAELADGAGDARAAQQLRDEAGPLRAAAGLPHTPTPVPVAPTGINAGPVGALLPLGVKADRKLNDDTIEALGLLAGATTGSGVVPVELRPAVDDVQAGSAVDDLARIGAAAIIGVGSDGAIAAAAARAQTIGIPLLSLAARPQGIPTGDVVFHVKHAAEARARGLAQRAIGHGVTSFVVLAPDTGYGRAMAKAFADEVTAERGAVVATVTYPRSTTSFQATVAKLPSTGWDAVFVADDADKLELVVPALATAKYYPKPLGTKKVEDARPVLLLALADGLSPRYVANAGRYSEGAWLAPGFYPDAADPAAKAFVEGYTREFGHAPGAFAAYAYDAAMLAAATAGGGRSAIAAKLGSGDFVGVTGTIRFDAQTHTRADPGVTYTVVEDAGVYSIHRAP